MFTFIFCLCILKKLLLYTQRLSIWGCYQPLAKSFIAGSEWEWARNVGAMNGVFACIYHALENSEDYDERETW